MPSAVERLAGLQAQDPKAPYIGLWTRLEGFDRSRLTRAVRRKQIVKATLMRATLHLVSAPDYALFVAALLPTLRGYWRRYASTRGDVRDIDELSARGLAFASEPRTAAELRAHLGAELNWWRIRFHTPFVNVPTGEDWAFERLPRYVSAGAWLGGAPADPVDGAGRLVRRYLAAFGPATRADIATWSGLPSPPIAAALESIELRRFRDERGRELLDLPRAPLPPPDMSAPPRLLPAFDNLILSHADRTRVIADEHRRAVIRGGIVDPVFLVDGFVAGRWRLERDAVLLEPFAPLGRSVERELRREGERLASFVS